MALIPVAEVNATVKFIVYTGRDISCRTHFYQMNFLIGIQSTSTTALITAIQTIMKVGSNHHDGFIPNGTHITTNGYPYELHFPEANSRIEDIGPNEFRSSLECYAYFEVT